MTGRRWLWIIAGFAALCVLGLVLVAGAGVYFVSHHIALQKTSSAAALRSLDSARARFSSPPLVEIDALERTRESRPTTALPTSPVRPVELRVLAWNPDEGRLARIALPLWVVRVGHHKIDFLRDESLDFEQLNLDVDELERIGPALILDYRTPLGARILIWTQ